MKNDLAERLMREAGFWDGSQTHSGERVTALLREAADALKEDGVKRHEYIPAWQSASDSQEYFGIVFYYEFAEYLPSCGYWMVPGTYQEARLHR